jgi:hypothetical protein
MQRVIKWKCGFCYMESEDDKEMLDHERMHIIAKEMSVENLVFDGIAIPLMVDDKKIYLPDKIIFKHPTHYIHYNLFQGIRPK